MKKARIFMAFATVCILIGGAVAAKAKKGLGTLYYCSTTNQCVLSPIYTQTITAEPASVPLTSYFTNTNATNTCTTTQKCNGVNPSKIYITGE